MAPAFQSINVELRDYQKAYAEALDKSNTPGQAQAINAYSLVLSKYYKLFEGERQLAAQEKQPSFDVFSRNPRTFFCGDEGHLLYEGDLRKDLEVLAKRMLPALTQTYLDGALSDENRSAFFLKIRQSMKLLHMPRPTSKAGMEAFIEHGFEMAKAALIAARFEKDSNDLKTGQDWARYQREAETLFALAGVRQNPLEFLQRYARRLEILLAEPDVLRSLWITDEKGKPLRETKMTTKEDVRLRYVSELSLLRLGSALGVERREVFPLIQKIFERTALQRSNAGLKESVELYLDKATEASIFARRYTEQEASSQKDFRELLTERAEKNRRR